MTLSRLNSILLSSLLALLLSACYSTRHIADDDQLFTGLTSINYTGYERNDHATQTQEELEAALATAPTGALFGSSYYRTPFPYRFWIWNITQEANGRFAQWMGHTIGKPPVLMSQVNPALRAQVARQVLRSNGYMHGDVTYQEVTRRNPKKAKISYTVHMDSLTRVDSLAYVNFPADMQTLIDSTRDASTLLPGSPFSVARLDAERTRLSQLFRNNGFYYFKPTLASYLADTFAVANRVNLRLQLADSLPTETMHPWYIGNTTVRLRRTFAEQTNDTIGYRFSRFLFSGKQPPIRTNVVRRNIRLRHRQLFSDADYQETMQKISVMGVFSNIDMQFTPRDGDTLDLLVDCLFDKPYDFYVETNFINRTIGRMGPEMKIGLTRRNAFQGAEKLDVNLHGSYEWQTNSGSGDLSTYQYGIDASIEFPRLVLPRFGNEAERRQRRRAKGKRFVRPFAPPTTLARVSSDVVRRPNYYKMHIVSGEWTYRWQPKATSRHELSPLTVNYQFMNSHTQLFDSLLSKNPYLSTTMSDYFIPKIRYTYTYTSPTTKHNPLRWEITLQESGNFTALYDVLIQGNQWNQKDKTLFKNPYSQFIKVETDLTKTWNLSPQTQLVGHVNAGLMRCFGNSDVAPFSETFYVGGANSIRAFPVRTIGPGAFQGIKGDNQFSYLTQNGDTKLVMNLELRHRLSGNLYGAVFLDAGNVWTSEDWSIKREDFEEEKEDVGTFIDNWNQLFSNNGLRLRTFFKQIATGTGVGLRYDLDFLVVRVDWGFGLHLPYDTGQRGYFNISRFKDMHTLHIAIGYPF